MRKRAQRDIERGAGGGLESEKARERGRLGLRVDLVHIYGHVNLSTKGFKLFNN